MLTRIEQFIASVLERKRQGGSTKNDVRILIIEGDTMGSSAEITTAITKMLSIDTAPVIVVDATDYVQKPEVLYEEVYTITSMDLPVMEYIDVQPSKSARKAKSRDQRRFNRRLQ